MKKNILLFLYFITIFILNLEIKANYKIIGSFIGEGNEKIRKCPDFECEIIKYGGNKPIIEILEYSKDWYKVNYIENDLTRDNITVGWIYKNLVPETIRETEGPKENFGPYKVIKNSKIYNCPSTKTCTYLSDANIDDIVKVVDKSFDNKWYSIKTKSDLLKDWDQWIKSENIEKINFSELNQDDKDFINDSNNNFYPKETQTEVKENRNIYTYSDDKKNNYISNFSAKILSACLFLYKIINLP